MVTALRRLFAEARPTDAPAPQWWDVALALAFFLGWLLEVAVRNTAPWHPLAAAALAPVAVTLIWRRRHPLGALLAMMVPVNLVDLLATILDEPMPDIYSGAFALILVYAVFRWGSGREIKWGSAVMLVALAIDAIEPSSTLGDAIGGFVILAATAEAGILVRRQRGLLEAGRHDARSQERAQLARELHDTVAHHVSAIAVQAQAGGAVLHTSPEAASAAFEAIEESAARALAEMRIVVDVLRRDAPLAPPNGVAELEQCAAGVTTPVHIERRGDLDALPPQIDAAVYRLVQESITNAGRHAVGATSITVDVEGTPDAVRVTVADDGGPVTFRPELADGRGLTGMQERASLLGGTFSAGPASGGGWRVEATLPRTAAARQRETVGR